uniref:magnesium chelatase n=1 Tax=Lepidodinium chlorophorum TaxID=107758 RepID=A0A0F7QZQ9_LEPCH|nr:Mg-protoporyphyrin IX chelatase [Lepidodinium chlorophorum]BAR72316.1 Mg-protoporyphyrin IX chelatase [Lepidodinium chlorophorum]
MNTNTYKTHPVFPFTAIIGQENIKISLVLNVLDPKIGGVMVMGDRGCGKSTTVRALIDLLPDIEVVVDDPFQSHPMDQDLISIEVRQRKIAGEKLFTQFRKTPIVNLPLRATEDRVCGTIDIEQALLSGIKAFEAGLLAQANRGILYIDEVNLLDDHLIDVLLDSAASGWNVVEREGISISHPARFILIGSGNPEEGELRPQLLDRFGLHTQIETTRAPELRAEIVIRRAKFDGSPYEFRQNWESRQDEMRRAIIIGSQLLKAKRITIDYKFRLKISELCGVLKIDGLRGDIAVNRAAMAYRAFLVGKKLATNPFLNHDIFQTFYVEIRDLKHIVPLALTHRMRKNPLQTPGHNVMSLINILNDLQRSIFLLLLQKRIYKLLNTNICKNDSAGIFQSNFQQKLLENNTPMDFSKFGI